MARWQKYELIAPDEVGYVPLAEIGAEFLFQVISERAERAAIIVTTNLPFSEWTTVFPNPRLCKALLDRITDRAHIIETGTEFPGRMEQTDSTQVGPNLAIKWGQAGLAKSFVPTSGG
jgi:DNA replication protein DnaC